MRLALLSPLVLAAGWLLPASAPGGEVPSMRAIVERFDAAQAKAETIKVPFTLSIKRAMLQTPAVTKGTLYLSGSDFAHFAFSPPEDLVIHLTNKSLVSYSPAEKKGEMAKFGLAKKVNRKFLGLGQQLSFMSDYFKMEASIAGDMNGAFLVTMKPRSLSMRKRMDLLQVWVDRETYLPRRFKWVERGGDTWLLEMGAMQLNVQIPQAVANFEMPPGTPTRQGFSFFTSKKK
jgi:outer membrane lipoprotein-sorting protein